MWMYCKTQIAAIHLNAALQNVVQEMSPSLDTNNHYVAFLKFICKHTRSCAIVEQCL